MYDYFFTIFVPTYNREHTLERLFESVERQTFKDFELIIVDDGSTDNTKQLIKEFKQKYSYPISYYYQENQGKHVARNLGIKLAKGYFFKTIDSDDYITDDCLELMKKIWDDIEDDRKKEFAGIIGLCVNKKTKEIIGDEFPSYILDSNHVLNSIKYKIKGDKTQCIKTDILKENLFPVFNNGKFIQEGIIWNRIGLKYQFRYVNEVMKYVDYQNDGLSRNSLLTSVRSKNGVQYFFKEYINKIAPNYNLTIMQILRKYIGYVRFSFHCNYGYIYQNRELPSTILHLLALPIGFLLYKKDLKVLNL